jgi:hypothetical protein
MSVKAHFIEQSDIPHHLHQAAHDICTCGSNACGKTFQDTPEVEGKRSGFVI